MPMKPAHLTGLCRAGLITLILASALVPLGDGFANVTRGIYAVGLAIALVLYWQARNRLEA
jgi:hypothetical protein